MKHAKTLLVALATLLASVGRTAAADLLGATGCSGGLAVVIDDQQTLTETLGTGDSWVVQALFHKAGDVEQARGKIDGTGNYGRLSASTWDGNRLPYVDDLVNVLIIDDPTGLEQDEIRRALAPGGAVLCRKGNGIRGLQAASDTAPPGWHMFRKPWPKEVDQWTHYLHDPQGTSVSQDLVAGRPRGLRWTGGPFWARSHEHTAGMQAMVSAAGRVFYVMDEGPVDSIQLPPKVFLTARDAFNGTVLWKRFLHDWWNPLFPLKSGPGWLPRRLVAVGDRVYLAPGDGQDLLCLDAATGKIVRTYADTASTFELIVSDGIVFAAVDTNHKPCDYAQKNANCWTEMKRASGRWAWQREQGSRLLKAIDAASGKVLWEHQMPIAPMTLSADSDKVCVYDGLAVIALKRDSGEQLWSATVSPMNQVRTGYGGPRLVLTGDRVLFSPLGQLFAIDGTSGQVQWSLKKKPRSGHMSLEDFYVLGDRAWVMQSGGRGGYNTYSLADGKLVQSIRNPINSFYIHQRCYPGRATTRFQLPPVMGIEVYDMKKDQWENNHWIRGGCIYGIMPANGMVYTPPNACACYYQSRLNGFNAVAPDPQSAKLPAGTKRLVKGPAYGKSAGTAYGPEAWPVFRHDDTRSGYARTDVSAQLHQRWRQNIGTKLSQPVVAGGKLVFSAVDRHRVFALDAESGKQAWSFVAGGRVDSPPTLYRGLALFGCADGCVYAVSLADGQLAWQFRVAPNDRQLMSYDQPESVWPLSGSVLIQNQRLYCVAGRSMFLDGGLRLVILDPQTGRLIAENVMDSHQPGDDKNLQAALMGKHMPVAMPDILSADGRYVYMKSQTFTPDGKRLRIRPQRPDTQYGDEVHLFCPSSFLDGAWNQRNYWIFGRAAGEGWAEFQLPPKRVPCGRIMCIDEDNAYSFGRDPALMCNTSVVEYWLFSAAKYPTRKVRVPRLEGKWVKGAVYAKAEPLAASTVDWHQLSKQPQSKLTALNYRWIHKKPDVQAKAMVLANDRLFIAGPRDVVDERQQWGRSNDPSFAKVMAAQEEWLDGAHGGILQVFAKSDGSKLAETALDCLPAFDGMVAANGRLYLSATDGSIRCYQ